ncbi:hypothetical protein SLEP1_g2282 [Rubroshorea leprosula]|uniref:Uncharacterized protein n=1 Tax=Rubroshorea leprosula TaxID=152421 RepID=A0AAV5HN63_9ROSI|nr:hypothetical protein SLEP1_g2282 [Rubroshorea leprosula]
MDWEQRSLFNEITRGRDLAKQLQNHLRPSSSAEMRLLLVEKIVCSYKKALSMLMNSRDIIGAPTVPLRDVWPLSRFQTSDNDQTIFQVRYVGINACKQSSHSATPAATVEAASKEKPKQSEEVGLGNGTGTKVKTEELGLKG